MDTADKKEEVGANSPTLVLDAPRAEPAPVVPIVGPTLTLTVPRVEPSIPVVAVEVPVVIPPDPEPDGETVLYPEDFEERKHGWSTARKRTTEQKEADLVIIAEKTAQSWNPKQIADYINSIRPYKISGSQIRFDIAKHDIAVKKRHKKTIEIMKARDLEMIEHLIREAYDEWQNSKNDRLSVKKETSKEGEKITHTKEKQFGDASYLNVIKSLLERRAKLLGMDAPIKTETDITAKVDHGITEVMRNAYKERVEIDVRKELTGIIEKPVDAEFVQE